MAKKPPEPSNVSRETLAASSEWFLETFNVSRETLHRLEQFAALIEKWQQAYNLLSDTTNLWQRHIGDSAQLTPYIGSKSTKILDLGSGAGFPGLVLSILGWPHIIVSEADTKKAMFLKEAIRTLSLEATLYHGRLEMFHVKHSTPVDVITCRAFASIDTILNVSRETLTSSTRFILPKGKSYKEEIAQAEKGWEFNYTVHPSKTDASGVIIVLDKIKQKP